MGFFDFLKKLIKKPNLDNGKFIAFFDLDGANCSSCSYAIEHVGQKFDGISYCGVNAVSSQIEIHYDGRVKNEERIIELVNQLGYTAKLVKKEERNLNSETPA